jgi:predicted nucleic acid-binding protein
MSNLVILETSVLVDHFRTRSHEERIAALDGVIRNSSVVLAELWRGVKSRREHDALLELEEDHPILVPSAQNWLESGRILGKIGKDRGFEPHKLRDLHFDLLIALTTRSWGALLITSNRADFELIHSYRSFRLEIWPASA